MSWAMMALATAVLAPWLAAGASFALGEQRDRARLVTGVAAGVVASAGALGVAFAAGIGSTATSIGIPLLGSRFAVGVDGLGALFAVVAAALWLVTTVYASGYMAHARNKARFFGFFAVCVGSAIGIALSENLLTLFVFYEALTLATYPLVVHSGTPAALRGGRTYLVYALSGGTLLAVGVIWLYAIGGGADFASGGVLPADLVASRGPELVTIFALLIAGFGVKAALFPAHGWLPAAMVAPAPVSALLHAVAVVKAGVFGIARVVLDVYGLDVGTALGVLPPLAGLAAFTLLFASVRALAQDDIKKRLAYSTIGQLSYIILGLALGSPLAAAAGLAHLAHHAVLKITMFFTAGVLAEELKIYRVSQMDGVGRRMPLTMTAFSLAALGIIGVPPIAGFVSKWGLGLGGLAAGEAWPLAVLGVSSVLNAAYLLPMIGRAWFGKAPAEWRVAPRDARGRREADGRMVWPLVLTAFVGLVMGLAARASWSPSSWAATIARADGALLVPWRAGAFRLDEPGMLFLVVAAIVWLAAGIGTWRGVTTQRTRYTVFFALSASGSVGLAFASGAGAFYACFSIMALSAYGLIAHSDSEDAQRAGRAYLAFTVVAEALLLAGLMLGSLGTEVFGAQLALSPWRDVGIGLLLVAFGVKIGAVGLGGWMPQAYREAPAGTSAALAGVVSTAGVLGMVRFLPGGVMDLATWGSVVMVAGLASALLGACVGSIQRETRHVLAYSSMSQFGLMTVGVGAGLASAELWPAAVSAVAIYLLHHGLAKAALFAGDDALALSGVRRGVLAGLAVPALALAGLPLTSGAVAKVALKGVAAQAPGSWAHALELLLPIAAVGTTLLMARFLWLAAGKSTSASAHGLVPGKAPARTLAFGILLAAVAAYLWLSGYEPAVYAAKKSLSAHYVWALTWPVLLGAGIAVTAWWLRGSPLARVMGRVPPGDVWARPLAILDRAWTGYQHRLPIAAEQAQNAQLPPSRAPGYLMRVLEACVAAERVLFTWPVASGGIVALAVVVLVLAW